MGGIGSIFQRFRSTPAQVKDSDDRFEREWQRQMRNEKEGIDAALAGKEESANPYDKVTQPNEWNMWYYGFSNASGELHILETGKKNIAVSSTAEEAWKNYKPHYVPVRQAIDGGWKPRYVPIERFDKKYPPTSTSKTIWRSTRE